MINVISSCLWLPGFKRDSCPWESREKLQPESCLSSSAAPPCVSVGSSWWEPKGVLGNSFCRPSSQLCSCSPHTLPIFFINAVSCTYLWSSLPDSSLRYVPGGCCMFSYWEYTVIVLPPSACPSNSSMTLHLLSKINFLIFCYGPLSSWPCLHTPSLLPAGHHSSHDLTGCPTSNPDVIFPPSLSDLFKHCWCQSLQLQVFYKEG